MIKSRNERSVCRVQLYYGTKAKEGTISSTRMTSQDNPVVEIIHFERTSLNGLCLIKFFILNRGWAFREREGISLLVHAYHSTLYFFSLFSLFCYFDSFLTIFSSFLMLAHVVLWRWWCCNSLLVVAIVSVMILCTAKALYILSTVTDFIILAFNHFCLD